GLVDEVWDRAEFWERVDDFARSFCPPRRAAKAVGLIKRSVQSGAEMSFADALALERELQQQLFVSEDAREGIAAYQEKRTPEFRGR
ncbi:MAG: enoyl-CoA hydratase/isomerase family protein, partial [Planctomycetes bacterium]|nr:enoyl-CoA hydratase/isomerase family protein [Planctomycetota bacterium]